MKCLEEVFWKYGVSQHESDAPMWFKAAMPHKDTQYNEHVCLKIMKLASRSVLLVVDRVKKLCAIGFI